MLGDPVLTDRFEDGWDIPLLVWRAGSPLRAVSSGPLGGGVGVRHWVVNATVPMSYHRDDPAAHLAELADRLGLDGPGIGLLTGVDVAEVVTRTDTGVRAWVTVGLGTPLWAAAPAQPATPEQGTAPEQGVASGQGTAPGHGGAPAQRVGTVNVVVYVPVALGDAALVNAVATATEAKCQAIGELGLPGTGTPTDAVTVLCPPAGRAEPYGGPRSTWGAPLARVVHAAVRDGGAVPCVPWSQRRSC
ncbi:adenosylcobinamide amidohydrolase [Micromonospora antibiotica]|uniref:Adenosylcobinamide amidohydrolase n=1 Tax=Micromonospora antibiotica TaxID=2807623 RepID=A0ABS3V8Y3_9ACTN|nr:adenosylcobinamide amidohydrolase [Micromonospora antibiotica]MBO4162064.1 adenosylcobinamide amidohydrolase [Micromonospora antibiotica]